MKKLIGILALLLGVAMPVAAFAYGGFGTTLLSTYTNDNVGPLTFTGYCNVFGICGTPEFTLNGSSSGSTTFLAASNASGTLTFPATTDTIATNGNLAPTGTISGQGIAFSTAPNSNPLVQTTVQSIILASVNTAGGYQFLTGVSGRTIYPVGLTVTAVGGTAAGASAVQVLCTSGNVLASIPVANFISGQAATFQSVSGMGFTGCATGDGVFISHTGSNVTTATKFFVNMPYSVQ